MTHTIDRRRLIHGGAAGLAALHAGLSCGTAAALQRGGGTRNPNVLRTPEAAFDDVDFPYVPRYTTVDVTTANTGPVRIASYTDGPRGGEPVLLMHGNPTWSYLYRDMMPLFAAAGYRVTAVDLYGFGRSDKPADAALYTYRAVEEAMVLWFQAQRLSGVNLFVQDWGGLIGLRVLAQEMNSFARVVTANTAFPSGGRNGEPGPTPTFLGFEQAVQQGDTIPAASFAVQEATDRVLSPGALADYDAPAPSQDFLTPFRTLPSLVPWDADQDGARRNAQFQRVLSRTTKPWLTLQGENDMITTGWNTYFQGLVPGATGQPHAVLRDVNHFCQEDAPDELVRRSVAFFAAN